MSFRGPNLGPHHLAMQWSGWSRFFSDIQFLQYFFKPSGCVPSVTLMFHRFFFLFNFLSKYKNLSIFSVSFIFILGPVLLLLLLLFSFVLFCYINTSLIFFWDPSISNFFLILQDSSLYSSRSQKSWFLGSFNHSLILIFWAFISRESSKSPKYYWHHLRFHVPQLYVSLHVFPIIASWCSITGAWVIEIFFKISWTLLCIQVDLNKTWIRTVSIFS